MKLELKENGFLARYIKKTVEWEKKRNREKPMVPFVSEKKQMWYYLMNQIDKTAPEENEKRVRLRNESHPLFCAAFGIAGGTPQRIF